MGFPSLCRAKRYAPLVWCNIVMNSSVEQPKVLFGVMALPGQSTGRTEVVQSHVLRHSLAV